MKHWYKMFAGCLMLFYLANEGFAQNDPSDSTFFYKKVRTYVNPVLPGDHPRFDFTKSGR